MLEDHDQLVVAQDELPDGSVLSTCWLGLDHGFVGPPLIFETMRFAKDEETIQLHFDGKVRELTSRPVREFPDPFGEPGATTRQLRYGSEEEAGAAHHEILRRIRLTEGH